MSKRDLLFSITFGLLLYLFAATIPANEAPMLLAYLETGLQDLNDSDRQSALHMLGREMSRGSDLDIEIRSLNSMDELLSLARQGRIQYAIINSYFFIKDRQRLMPWLKDEMWAIQRGDTPQEDYVIVVNKQLNYQNFASLQGKCLSLRGDYMLMSSYLDLLLRSEVALGLQQFFKTVKNPRTVSQGILDVYFNVCDATIVPQHILDLVTELNPAVLEKVAVVHRSGAHFIPALGLVFKNATGPEADVVRDNLHRINNRVRGQEILDLFKIRSIRQIEPESLNFMLNFFAADRKKSRKVGLLP